MTSMETQTDSPSPARRITLMAAGLVILAASFAFAVPRRAEIAAALAPPMTLDVPTDMPDMEPAAPEAASEEDAPAAPTTPPDAAASAEPSEPAAATGAEPAPEAAPASGATTTEVMQVLSRPIAVDTSTFLVGQARVKLLGVEPPAVGERCELAGGSTWPCGAKARTALRAWIRARSIRCEVPADFARSTSRTESTCTLENKDIGAWLVENGWAKAAPGSRYADAEAKAREARLGLWGNP